MKTIFLHEGRAYCTTALILITIFGLSTLGLPRQVQGMTVIYTNSFELGAGAEWSNIKTEFTPIGNRRYLGRFGNGVTNVLTLTNLPPHTNLTLLFDLFAIRSWDGNQGPDIWDVREAGSATPIFRTTFSDNGNRQAFPGSYAGGDYFRRSGASEVGTLGYTFNNGAGPGPSDSVYPMRLTFSHSSNSLALQFSASLAGAADESWGLDNLVLVAETLPSAHITSVTNKEFYSAPASVLIDVSIETGDEPVERVELYANQSLLAVWTNQPYSLVWSNVPSGMFTLRARAWTASGLWGDDLVSVSVNGLRGDYFNNAKLSGSAVTRFDPTINYNWGDNSPIPGVGSGSFSVRWTGLLVPKYSETYSISTGNDDGVRVWIGGQKLIDEWYLQVGAHTNQMQLEAGLAYPIMVEFFDGECCGAKMRLFWESPHQLREIIPQTQLFPPDSLPPVLFVRSLGSQVIAVEWTTNSPGFILFGTANLSAANWTSNFSKVIGPVTNGMNRVTVNSTDSQMFFRLVK